MNDLRELRINDGSWRPSPGLRRGWLGLVLHFFKMDYQRKTYAGRVRSVVWNRCDGYGVKVIYSDAFEERLSIHEIHTLLGQQKVQPVKSRSIHAGLSTRVVERCAGGWVQEPMNTDMRHELSDRRLYNNEENKRIIKICKKEASQEGFLHEKYVGKCFYKWFLLMNGVGAEFVGTVTEVWWGTDQKTFFARVVYEDGDREDMSLSEQISLVYVENDSSKSYIGLHGALRSHKARRLMAER